MSSGCLCSGGEPSEEGGQRPGSSTSFPPRFRRLTAALCEASLGSPERPLMFGPALKAYQHRLMQIRLRHPACSRLQGCCVSDAACCKICTEAAR